MKMKKMLLGIDIGGTKCSVSIGALDGEVVEAVKFPTNADAGHKPCVSKIIETANELRKRHSAEFAAIGIPCGSPLDPERMIIQAPPHLPTWVNVPIGEITRNAFGNIPIQLENDANAGALAENLRGAGRGAENMLFLTFGTGLGAGLILNGKIYRGTTCLAGELGHIRLEKDGPGAPRKAGSLEGFCSGDGIAQLAKTMSNNFKKDTILKKNPTAADVGKGAEAGDELCLEILRVSGEHLGRGLAIVIDLLNPEKIVIGSIFRRCERFLRPAMEKALEEECMRGTLAACEVLPAQLGETLGDVAAIALARSALTK